MSLQSTKAQKLLHQIQQENEKLNSIVVEFKKQLEDVKLISINRTIQLQLVDDKASQILQELKTENNNLEQITYLIEFQTEKNKKLAKIRQIAAIQNKMLETLLEVNEQQKKVSTPVKGLNPKDFQCTKDGLFGETVTNCSHFFICSWTNTRHQTKSRLSCPKGTIFNSKIGACDWPRKSNAIIC